MNVDLNCDMGEGMGNDEAIMPFISSANIACGYHAGNEQTMLETIALALKYGVAVGAHPSYPDRANFGRTAIQLPIPEVYELVKKQVVLMMELCAQTGAILHHVKPHGALYNAAAISGDLAQAVAQAVKDTGTHLILYGLNGSLLITKAQKIGLQTAGEVFADRTYMDDGTLTPRLAAGALITEETKVCAQVLRMVQSKKLIALSGKEITVDADTICIHGDGEHAVAFAKAIHSSLQKNGIDVKAG